MRRLTAFCLLVFAVSTLHAAVQYSARQDIATGFKLLYGIAIADFNGDGKQDIAVTDGHDKKIVVYLNKGNGSFAAPIVTTLQLGDTVTSLVPGDFNEDGKQDLIASTGNLTAVVFLSGNGDGFFTQQAPLTGNAINSSGTPGFFDAVAVDINGDSHLDLIEAGNGSFFVHLGDGHGGFTLQALTNQGSYDVSDGVVAGDFNNDQNIDFLGSGYSTSNLYYFSGNGRGGFAAPTLLSSAAIRTPDKLKAADLNGDGKLDLLLASASAKASVIFGNGDGTFQLLPSQIVKLKIPVTFAQLNASTAPPSVAIADMDGNGKQDAVTADSVSNSVNVFLNDGTGKFPQTTPDFTAALPAGDGDLRIADLNGDGLPGIVVTNYLTQNISIFLSIRPMSAPTITLTTTANQQLVGTSITLTTKVSGAPAPFPTGIVTLLDGMTSSGQQTLDANGQATFSVSSLTAGQHVLSVSYSGDKNYFPGTSTATSQAVTDFQLASSATSQTVTRGTSASYSVAITPVAGFSGNITFTCTGLPATSTCATNSIAIVGQPATATITVTTTPASQFRAGLHSSLLLQSATMGLASLVVAFLLQSRGKPLPRLLTLVIAVLALGSFSGCSGKSPPVNTGSPGSLTGSYPFTIAGSTMQGGQTVNHQVSAVLVIN